MRFQHFLGQVLRFQECLIRRARALLGAGLEAASFTDEVQIIANMRTPLAIAHGAEEQLVNLDYLYRLTIPSLWRGAVQVIPDAGHSPIGNSPNGSTPYSLNS